MVNLSKFTSNNKNIKWNCMFNLQLIFLSSFAQNLIMLGLKNFRVVTIFLEGKKNHKVS